MNKKSVGFDDSGRPKKKQKPVAKKANKHVKHKTKLSEGSKHKGSNKNKERAKNKDALHESVKKETKKTSNSIRQKRTARLKHVFVNSNKTLLEILDSHDTNLTILDFKRYDERLTSDTVFDEALFNEHINFLLTIYGDLGPKRRFKSKNRKHLNFGKLIYIRSR